MPNITKKPPPIASKCMKSSVASTSFKYNRQRLFDDDSMIGEGDVDSMVSVKTFANISAEDSMEICNYRLVQNHKDNKAAPSSKYTSDNMSRFDVNQSTDDHQFPKQDQSSIDELEDTLTICSFLRSQKSTEGTVSTNQSNDTSFYSASSTNQIFTNDSMDYDLFSEFHFDQSTDHQTLPLKNEVPVDELDDTLKICSYRRPQKSTEKVPEAVVPENQSFATTYYSATSANQTQAIDETGYDLFSETFDMESFPYFLDESIHYPDDESGPMDYSMSIYGYRRNNSEMVNGSKMAYGRTPARSNRNSAHYINKLVVPRALIIPSPIGPVGQVTLSPIPESENSSQDVDRDFFQVD